jgi:hypothetical protein
MAPTSMRMWIRVATFCALFGFSTALCGAVEPQVRIVSDALGAWFEPPDGRRFFSVGVCCIAAGQRPEITDPENPAYSALSIHPNLKVWAAITSARLRNWKFTTIGGWSDLDALAAVDGPQAYVTPVLGVGAAAGAPWWDMWDEENVHRMEEAARKAVTSMPPSAKVLGYYSDNELGWWNAALWKATLEQAPSSGQRRWLVGLVREAYSGSWEALRQDFEPEHASGFESLDRGGMLYLHPGGRGVVVMRRFLELLADRYYGLMREILGRAAPGVLYLGDRYPSFYYPEVARAAGRHVDALSSNLNAHWNDGTFLRCYFDTLHSLSGRPIVVSEFYAAASENRSGNRNDYGVYPVSRTQRERALVAGRTLRELARLPWVIGADWFQFADEPMHGRDDGENFNFGLVDHRDRPYEAVTTVFARFDPQAERARREVPGPTSFVAPRAPKDPFGDFRPPIALMRWDRESGFLKARTPDPMADLYVCWSNQALYLGLYSMDIVEPAYYRNAFVPKVDRPYWVATLNGREIFHARIGAGREPLISDSRVRIANSSGTGGNVSDIAAVEIPATLLGANHLRAGDRVTLVTTLISHAGAARTEWSAEFTLGAATRR